MFIKLIGVVGVVAFAIHPALAGTAQTPPAAKVNEVKPPEAITPSLKADRDMAIQACEKQYADVKKLKERFASVNKPGSKASSEEKNRYKNLDLYKRFFDGQFGQFSEFTNDKIKLRTMTDPKKLAAAVAEYTRNCRLYSEFQTGFIDWATVGKAPKGMDVIYQKQIDAFKKQK
jgi:hypothetical protein